MADIITRSMWTPIVTAQTPGDLSVSYGQQIGVWGGVSPLVRLGFDIIFTPTYTTAASFFIVGGVPLPAMPPLSDLSLWAGELRGVTNFTWPTGATQLIPIFLATGAGIVISAVGTGFTTTVPITSFVSGTQYRIQASITDVTTS